MRLTVYRKIYTSKSTIGELHLDGKFFCYTLEDHCRDKNRDGDLLDEGETKVFGKTAIPAGTYPVILSFSNRFKKLMPEVLNVPGYAGIRIHNGNTPEHTEGCLLVGSSIDTDFVGNSKITFAHLMAKLQVAAKNEKMVIEYIDVAVGD